MDTTYEDNLELLLRFYKSKSVSLRNQIVEKNMGLVHHVARKMTACCTLPVEELIQIGAIGLIKAVENFKPEKKHKLSSLAVPFIQGTILQFLRDKGRLVKVPRGIQETHQKIKRRAEKQGISYEDAALELGVSPQFAKECSIACGQITSELPDSLSQQQQEELETVLPLLEKLPEFHAVIIKALYFDKVPIRKLGQLHLISVHKIKIIEAEALQQLKAIAAGQVQCPKCKKYQNVKNGNRTGNQSYLCKSCGYQFVKNPLPVGRRGYSKELKLKTLKALSEGKSFYWCEIYLKIDHSTAFLWAKKYVINDSNLLSIKVMTPIQQHWQITNKFNGLADWVSKNCPESIALDAALQLLSQAMLKTQQSLEAAKK